MPYLARSARVVGSSLRCITHAGWNFPSVRWFHLTPTRSMRNNIIPGIWLRAWASLTTVHYLAESVKLYIFALRPVRPRRLDKHIEDTVMGNSCSRRFDFSSRLQFSRKRTTPQVVQRVDLEYGPLHLFKPEHMCKLKFDADPACLQLWRGFTGTQL